MQKIIAEIISYLLNPAILAVVGVSYITYRTTLNFSIALFWGTVTGVFAAIVAGFIIYGMREGLFSNIDVSKRNDRYYLYPFILMVMAIFITISLMWNAPASLTSAIIFLIPTVMIFQIINTKIKGSIHMASITGAAVGFAYYYAGWYYLLLLLVPLVAWARIKGKKHTKNEVIIGTIFGAVFAIIGVYIVQFFR